MQLSQQEIQQMKQTKAYFPFRKIAGVKLQDGTFEVFAAATMAKANNFARKNDGLLFVFGD